tara:strand:+ start:1467 stop:1694 length:228 start_codon:yes stop_codon:yes gene_type:complete
MSTKYMEIDSDIGPIQLKLKYEIDYGERGDYHQPPVHPSVNIFEVKLDGEITIHPSVKEDIEYELLQELRDYDPD